MAKTPPAPGTPEDLARWAQHLRRIGESGLPNADLESELRAALARPHWIGGPLLAAMRVRRCGPLAPDLPAAHVRESLRLARDDAALWWALVDESMGPVGRWIEVAANGPLFRQDACRSIEVWTEMELTALHALSHHARRADGDAAAALSERVRRTVEWHVARTQPDNATNHPWAVHVFLLHDTPESRHFAETLVSNCMVQSGRADALSAWILLDAAEAIDAGAKSLTLPQPGPG
ncbi:MAG: hypothetical protein KJZ69_07100 [Phycisphaerales bacterium]|nr:hypothetical protein [Phycisphaerales bacterium]